MRLLALFRLLTERVQGGLPFLPNFLVLLLFEGFGRLQCHVGTAPTPVKPFGDSASSTRSVSSFRAATSPASTLCFLATFFSSSAHASKINRDSQSRRRRTLVWPRAPSSCLPFSCHRACVHCVGAGGGSLSVAHCAFFFGSGVFFEGFVFPV